MKKEEHSQALQIVQFVETPCEAQTSGRLVDGFCDPSKGMTNACKQKDDHIQRELLALGKRGETIAHAREEVLRILESENSCSDWLEEADPDPAGTFRSLRFVVDENGPRKTYARKDFGQGLLIKQPYVASSWENTGRNSTIQLNANGAFFIRASQMMQQDQPNRPVRPGGMHELHVASFTGNSTPAQVTALLHELGHIIGRLPPDDDSWDGESARNTAKVMRSCRQEIVATAKKSRQAGD